MSLFPKKKSGVSL